MHLLVVAILVGVCFFVKKEKKKRVAVYAISDEE